MAYIFFNNTMQKLYTRSYALILAMLLALTPITAGEASAPYVTAPAAQKSNKQFFTPAKRRKSTLLTGAKYAFGICCAVATIAGLSFLGKRYAKGNANNPVLPNNFVPGQVQGPILDGFNFEAQCKNKACAANGKSFWVNKEYSSNNEPFNLVAQICRTFCTTCGKNFNDDFLGKFAFKNCTYKIEIGYPASEEGDNNIKELTTEGTANGTMENKLYGGFFENLPENTDYRYLTITATPLLN